MLYTLIFINFILFTTLLVLFLIHKTRTEERQTFLITELQKVYDSNLKDSSELKNEVQNKLAELNKNVISVLQHNNQEVRERFDSSSKLYVDLKSSLSRIDEANKKILDLGGSIHELQNILKAPKTRGLFGEFLLEDLLSQIFPKSNYAVQYSYKTKNRMVDAIIKLKEGIIPIDAKFPLEYFNKMNSNSDENNTEMRKLFIKMVKTHITNISEKYIDPSEGTLDFAIMYIPAENVYYEAIIKDELSSEVSSLLHFSINKKVIPVSPNTFFAYLQTLLFGLKGMRIEEEAMRIMKNLSNVERDLNKFSENFNQLGVNIERLRSSFGASQERWSFLRKRISHAIHKEELIQDGGISNEKVFELET